MEELKKLVKQEKSELHDAKKYIKCALAHRTDDNKMLTQMYQELSQAELRHYDLLHDAVERWLEVNPEYREAYSYMQNIFDDKVKEIKMYENML